jgi:hypothetical protein
MSWSKIGNSNQFRYSGNINSENEMDEAIKGLSQEIASGNAEGLMKVGGKDVTISLERTPTGTGEKMRAKL